MDLKLLQETPPWEWPPTAAGTFLDVLTDKQAAPSDRLIAAELAGDYVAINDELSDALLAVLVNDAEPDDLRAQAAISFGAALESAEIEGYDDPDALPPISEFTFRKIQNTLQRLFANDSTPKPVRRRILEASVRADEPWHEDAIAQAYATGDRDWVLTAVFAMRFVRGFEVEVLESLNAEDSDIHLEAVRGAGGKELDEAWPHVVELVEDPGTDEELLLAAIEAVASIRPAEAREVLDELTHSEDEDIAEAAEDAIMMADASLANEEELEEEEEEGPF